MDYCIEEIVRKGSLVHCKELKDVCRKDIRDYLAHTFN